MSESEVDTYPIEEGLKGLAIEVSYGFAGLASAIRASLIANGPPNERDADPNVVDGLFAIADSIAALAGAINRLSPKGKEAVQ